MRLPTDQPIFPAPGGFRRWIRSDMLTMRWVFLALYAIIVIGLACFVLSDSHDAVVVALVAAMFVSQALLILGTGSIRLCHPIRRRRLIFPIAAAASMLTILIGGFVIAMAELLYLDHSSRWTENTFILFLFANWIGWGVLLWFHLRGKTKHNIISRIAGYLFVGSLADLFATVPAHVIVSKRPGCLVGIGTMLGIVAGIYVMLFSFGPMIFLLFLRPKLRAELHADGKPYCPACGYDLRATPDRCPECGLAVHA